MKWEEWKKNTGNSSVDNHHHPHSMCSACVHERYCSLALPSKWRIQGTRSRLLAALQQQQQRMQNEVQCVGVWIDPHGAFSACGIYFPPTLYACRKLPRRWKWRCVYVPRTAYIGKMKLWNCRWNWCSKLCFAFCLWRPCWKWLSDFDALCSICSPILPISSMAGPEKSLNAFTL